jgi:hypothetical protein
MTTKTKWIEQLEAMLQKEGMTLITPEKRRIISVSELKLE